VPGSPGSKPCGARRRPQFDDLRENRREGWQGEKTLSGIGGLPDDATVHVLERFLVMQLQTYTEPQPSLWLAADDEVFLTARQVCKQLGGISLMTLWRWLDSDAVRFPPPTMRIKQRRYWSAISIRRWLAERAAEEGIA
jgi:predicted DNA-binding transcriptional regulator AlpA